MNQWLDNVVAHPKTTVVGLLTFSVTVLGVLQAQGVDFGKVGTGTWVTLLTSLASSLMLLVSKDPSSN
jgi:hypothetical protein